jgi:hypothetical protein
LFGTRHIFLLFFDRTDSGEVLFSIAILMLESFRNRRNGPFIPSKETPVTLAEKKRFLRKKETMATAPTFLIEKEIANPALKLRIKSA